MKKFVSLVLAFVLCFALCACSSSKDKVDDSADFPVVDTDETPAANEDDDSPADESEVPEKSAPPSAPEEPTVPAEPEVVIYNLGDAIATEQFIVEPVFTGYAYELANWPDEGFMTPGGQFSGESAYSASAEKVVIYGEVLIEYVGSDKSNVSLKIDISADYDDGYIFDGACVDTGYCYSVDGDWTYSNTMTFEPLSSNNTRIMRYCIEVPEQVEANKDKALLVTFCLNNEAYVYDFRSADVLGSDYDPRGEFYQPIDEETKSQIVSYLKENGLEAVGWYDTTVGVYTFTFGDTEVEAVLPINSSYVYEFVGTYEVYSGAILFSWDYGQQMHIDYSFDGTTFEVIEFAHDR